VLKKTFALAVGLSLLTGCIASREFGNLSDTLSKGTLLTRSLTASNPGDGNVTVTNFLGWIMLNQSGAGTLKRDGNILKSDLSGSAYTDKDGDPVGNDIAPDTLYTYELTFGNSTATQSIRTRSLPDTTFSALTPNGPLPSDDVAAGSKPQLSWTKNFETPKGFIVTVTRLGDYTAGFGGGGMSGEPYYVSFLNAASHSAGVTYGTPSDLDAIVKDELLSKTLSEMPGGFFKAENKDLVSGRYIWTVVAIDHDDAKTAFAISSPTTVATFGVQ